MTIAEILTYLESNASEKLQKNLIKLGIPAECTLGVPTAELRKLAKKIPNDKAFLIELWQTNYHECQLLTILAFAPEECGNQEIDLFMKGINSWDLCDLFCKSILIKQPNFDYYITKWLKADGLYYKRAAFTLIASTSTQVALTNKEINRYLSFIMADSDDERLLIKKAASWALRELGKTNLEAKEESLKTAQKMLQTPEMATLFLTKIIRCH